MCDMLTKLFPVLLTLTLAPSFTLSAEGGPGDRTGYYHCDFNGGAIPEGITTIDNDGQPLHFTMVQLGFAERDSWICTREGRTLEAEYSGLGLGYGESFRFEFDEEIHAVYGDKVGFTLTPLVNGTEYDPIAMESLILNFEPRRNVVIEEFTGMWCGYCPQGIVAFDILEEKNQGWRAIRVQTDVQVAGKYPRQRKSQCGRPRP